MTSGGRRTRSGPNADANSGRQSRPSAGGWVELLEDAHVDTLPAWPLPDPPSPEEEAMWGDLWFKPQSLEWHRLGMHRQVAFYVQTFHLALDPESAVTMRTAVLRMEDSLGISPAGLASLKWRIVDRRQHSTSGPKPPRSGTNEEHTAADSSPRARLRLIKSA